jgi:hypothetical protein
VLLSLQKTDAFAVFFRHASSQSLADPSGRPRFAPNANPQLKRHLEAD